jgi:uncharacterized protein (UPF0212 family)
VLKVFARAFFKKLVVLGGEALVALVLRAKSFIVRKQPRSFHLCKMKTGNAQEGVPLFIVKLTQRFSGG